MKKFLLFPLLLFLTNLNAQKPTFINNHFNPSKNKRIEIGIMGQGVIQDFSIGFGAYLKCNLVETLYYNLDINGELYPSLMYAGYMIGGGGKIGIRNHFRLFKGNGISIGFGKNVRSTIYNFALKKIDVIPLVSNFQIDIGYTFYEQKSRRRYKLLGGVYISYSNIKSNSLNRFYPWSHVFEFTGYGVL